MIDGCLKSKCFFFAAQFTASKDKMTPPFMLHPWWHIFSKACLNPATDFWLVVATNNGTAAI
jgi:hypothetical protein